VEALADDAEMRLVEAGVDQLLHHRVGREMIVQNGDHGMTGFH